MEKQRRIQRPLRKQKLPERKLCGKNTARPEDLAVSFIHIKFQVNDSSYTKNLLETIKGKRSIFGASIIYFLQAIIIRNC